jgi:hypothetical protein
MTASNSFSTTVLFEPEALQEMAVATKTCAPPIPKHLRRTALQAAIARRIIMYAAAGPVDSVERYLACVSSLHVCGRIPYLKICLPMSSRDDV